MLYTLRNTQYAIRNTQYAIRNTQYAICGLWLRPIPYLMFTKTPSIQNSTDKQTWQSLWSHTASEIISSFSDPFSRNRLAADHCWGLYDPANPQRMLCLHPSSMGKRAIGDLSLTMLGAGTFVIPRNGSSYVEYIRQVSDVVKATAKPFFS